MYLLSASGRNSKRRLNETKRNGEKVGENSYEKSDGKHVSFAANCSYVKPSNISHYFVVVVAEVSTCVEKQQAMAAKLTTRSL